MSGVKAYWWFSSGSFLFPLFLGHLSRCKCGGVGHLDADLGASICRSILVNSCVPYTYTVQGEPNLSSTQWRSYANTRDLRYYFDIVTNYGYYYVDLNRCNLRKGAPVMKLDTSKTMTLVGDATDSLVPSKPFTPMY